LPGSGRQYPNYEIVGSPDQAPAWSPYTRRMGFIIKVLVGAAALWVADRLISGIELTGDIWQILLIALVFGIVNALLKPLVKILSIPFLIITLGLFAIVINMLMLAITAGLMENLTVDGFLAAFLGSLVISIVTAVLNFIIPDSSE
jgi:putative membrane protein